MKTWTQASVEIFKKGCYYEQKNRVVKKYITNELLLFVVCKCLSAERLNLNLCSSVLLKLFIKVTETSV